jgi:hypothetical protein
LQTRYVSVTPDEGCDISTPAVAPQKIVLDKKRISFSNDRVDKRVETDTAVKFDITRYDKGKNKDTEHLAGYDDSESSKSTKSDKSA